VQKNVFGSSTLFCLSVLDDIFPKADLLTFGLLLSARFRFFLALDFTEATPDLRAAGQRRFLWVLRCFSNVTRSTNTRSQSPIVHSQSVVAGRSLATTPFSLPTPVSQGPLLSPESGNVNSSQL
jgi:hypothetical protein